MKSNEIEEKIMSIVANIEEYTAGPRPINAQVVMSVSELQGYLDQIKQIIASSQSNQSNQNDVTSALQFLHEVDLCEKGCDHDCSGCERRIAREMAISALEELHQYKQPVECPEKLQTFMKMLMKEARRYSLLELCDSWGISEQECDQCTDYIQQVLQVKL